MQVAKAADLAPDTDYVMGGTRLKPVCGELSVTQPQAADTNRRSEIAIDSRLERLRCGPLNRPRGHPSVTHEPGRDCTTQQQNAHITEQREVLYCITRHSSPRPKCRSSSR